LLQEAENELPTNTENDKLHNAKNTGDDFENDLEANTSAFEALERDFQEVCLTKVFINLI